MLDAVLAFIDTVIPGQRFVVAGLSYGGYLARGVVYRRAASIDGVLLCAPQVTAEPAQAHLPRRTTLVEEGYLPLSRFWETVSYGELKHELTITAAQCDDSNSSIRFLPCLHQKFSLVFPQSPYRMSSERIDQMQKQEAEPGWLALN
jgi:pimeloyl-ACP methyl ester carboxylesterase